MTDQANAGLEIRECRTRQEMDTFIDVPWRVFREDPNWVPPLKFERRDAYSEKNPFFKHARCRFWIALKDGEAVGRISAQIDDLFLKGQHPTTGFFGLLDAIEDPAVFERLLATASDWLRSEGMTRLAGPFNLGINQEIGTLVEGFDSPPYVMMGHARPYYDSIMQSLGLEKATDVLAYEILHHQFLLTPRIQRLLDRQAHRIEMRVLDRRQKSEELEKMRDVFNDAWSENWGFVPFTKDEFQAVGKELMMIVPRDFIYIADVDGEASAFIVLLPNLNEAIRDLDGRLFPFGWLKLLWRLKFRLPRTGRVPLMGVRKRYQSTRLGPALAFALVKALHGPAGKRGMDTFELSWILEGNQNMRGIIESMGTKISKRYRMYQKPLV